MGPCTIATCQCNYPEQIQRCTKSFCWYCALTQLSMSIPATPATSRKARCTCSGPHDQFCISQAGTTCLDYPAAHDMSRSCPTYTTPGITFGNHHRLTRNTSWNPGSGTTTPGISAWQPLSYLDIPGAAGCTMSNERMLCLVHYAKAHAKIGE